MTFHKYISISDTPTDVEEAQYALFNQGLPFETKFHGWELIDYANRYHLKNLDVAAAALCREKKIDIKATLAKSETRLDAFFESRSS